MEWIIYNVLSILIETVQLENISIIVKVNSRSFELCIVCLLKNLFGQNYKETIRTFGSSLVVYM